MEAMSIFQYPCIKAKDLGIGLLKKLIAKAGLTNEEYIELFYKQ
jgi:hypothetical protein